jgi:hypothetical protein
MLHFKSDIFISISFNHNSKNFITVNHTGFRMVCPSIGCIYFSLSVILYFDLMMALWGWNNCSNIILFLIKQGFVRLYFIQSLRSRSAAACLMKLWVRFPPWAWVSFSSACCVLSDRGLCDEPITRPNESYRLWCVVACGLETSWMRRPWPALGHRVMGGGELHT